MSQTVLEEIEEIRSLLAERTQASGDLPLALRKARRQLPRRIYRQGMRLAEALPLLEHPKLSLTLDQVALHGASREVTAHLRSINLAERRKDRLLQVLGSMAFSLLAVVALLILVLRWRGFV